MVKDKIFKVFCSSDMVSKVFGSGLIQRCNRWRLRRAMPIYIFLLALSGLFLNSMSYGAVIYINSIEELQKIGNDPNYPLNGEYELTQDIDASDTINWNNGAGFNPIGLFWDYFNDKIFTGKFDGKGYKITGLYINRPGTENMGLFGWISSNGEVKNLGIENYWIIGYQSVGGLAGINNGTLLNCYSKGTMVGYATVGGLVGENRGGKVTNCYSIGSVTGSSENVGGLIGYNSGTVSNCYSMGTVEGSSENVGGLIGYNSGTVSNCYSTVAVTKEGDGYDTGGLVGENGGTVSNCYSTGSVTGTDSVGGLVGGCNGGTVSNCYSTGSVTGYKSVGGLVGWNMSTVSFCYSTGPVSGNNDVGGLVGSNGSTVWNCYWDIQTSGRNSSAGGTGKTTVEMKQKTTYNTWNFVSIWGINEGFSYPYFLWQLLTIPDIVGMTQAEAENAITGAKLTVGTISQQCSNTVEAGKVISQSPSAGQQVSPGTSVNLVVSTGPCPEGEGTPEGTPEGVVEGTPEGTPEGIAEGEVNVSVPNVVGMTQSNATSAITGTGLTVGTVSQQCSNTVEAGKVISQNPSAGQQVSPGTAVNLVVSTGPCPVSVPNVVGMTQANASGAITGVGLIVGTVSQQCSNTVEAGKVISQTPSSGQQVTPGTAVNIVVSTGPCPVTVPDVLGILQNTAESMILAAGLYVGTVSQQCSNTVEAGKVISQNPSAGQQVSPGTAVNIAVSTGPCPVTVPDVLGILQNTAESMLLAAGLYIGTVSQQCSNTVEVGKVISQNPSAGQQVSPGTAVNLVVSTGPCPVSVPNVVGMTQANASSAIIGTGLTVGTVSQQCSNTVEAGKVISQTPSAGQQVSPGTAVNLVVSTGPCPVSVPDVVGMTQANATNAITGAGLTVGTVSQQCSNTVEAGKVISQTPSAGQQVSPGTAVNIVVSTGPCNVIVPNVVGRTETQARGAIEAAGLVFNPVYECNDTVNSGNVIRQNPSGDAGVQAGSTVTVWISTGPCTGEEAVYKKIWAYAGVDHVYVLWEGSIAANLLGYRLYRSEDNKTWTVIAGVNDYYKDTSYRDYGIVLGKTYWYKVDITKGGGQVETLGPVQVEMGRIVLWVPEIEWKVGGTGNGEIHVPVNIGNAMGLKPSYMNIDVSYNAGVLEVVRVEKTAVSAAMQVYYNTGTSGVVKVGMAPRNVNAGEVLYGEGHLFDMVFRLKGGISDGAESKFEFIQNELFDKEGSPIAVEVRSGRLVVQSTCLRGDINGDGKVLMVDAGLLLKRIAKRDWSESEYPCLLKRGDINGDGILDVADVSMLMRWSVGLSVNPPQSDVVNQKNYSSYMKMVGSDTEVIVIGGSPSGEEMNEFGVGFELSSLGGLGGLEVVLGYGSGLEYKDVVLDNRFLGFNKEVSYGTGYVRVSLSSKDAITEDVPGRVMVFKFKVTGASGDRKETRELQLREVRLKGVYGDDFRWYGEVKRTDGVIEVCPAIKDMRGSDYNTVAQWLTGAGYVPDKREENNIEVAVGKVIGTEPSVGVVLKSGSKVVVIVSKGGTKEQLLEVLRTEFNVLDKNGDGGVSWEEASSKYAGLTREVFDQVDSDGDGKISRTEAGLKKSLCGCSSKSLGEGWWKYLVDFVLFGLVISLMSGMGKRQKRKE